MEQGFGEGEGENAAGVHGDGKPCEGTKDVCGTGCHSPGGSSGSPCEDYADGCCAMYRKMARKEAAVGERKVS